MREIPGYRNILQKMADEKRGNYPDSYTRPMVIAQVANRALAEAVVNAYTNKDTNVADYAREMQDRVSLIARSAVAKKAKEISRKESQELLRRIR